MAIQQQFAARQRVQQTALRARVVATVMAAWLALFEPDDGTAWDRLRGLLAALVSARHRTSAGLAAVYYRQARAVAGVPGDAPVRLADEPPAAQVHASLDATGPGAYDRALRAGQTPEQARRTASVTLSGSAGRMAGNGGRLTVHNTVHLDEAALGFIRVTDAHPCSFCAMLASRGPVYKSARTAGDPRAGGVRYHDHDGCVAAPVFRGSDEPWVRRSEELSDEWGRVTAGHSGQAARDAWRRHWEGKEG